MSQDVLSVHRIVFGSLGFAIIYNIRGRRVLIPAIGGAVFWAVYLVFLHFVNNEYLGFFVVAILITIYSEIWARVLKTPATTILMPTVIPLIPGGSLYYAMDAALRHDRSGVHPEGPESHRACGRACGRNHDRYVIEAADRGAGAHSS